MKLINFILLITIAFTQEKIWVKVNSGTALYLNPYTAKWIPINGREEVPVKTYFLIKENTEVELYRETDVLRINQASYFFLADAFVEQHYEILSNLARIEAEQFPPVKNGDSKRQVGLIYGSENKTKDEFSEIPNLVERKQAVEIFIQSNHFAPALLSQKRMMSKFPQLYEKPEQLKRLFILYDYHGLTEYVFEETKRLKTRENSKEVETLIHKYYEDSRLKLSAN